MSEMITKNHALIAEFGDSLDRLLDGIENFMANSRPTLGGERFLTDREVSARLKVSRRTLQDYDGQGGVGTAESEPTHLAGLPQQRHNRLLPVGRQDSIQGIGHRTDACRQLSGGVQIASIIADKRNTTRRHQVVFLTSSGRISFVSTTWGFSCICRRRKEQV